MDANLLHISYEGGVWKTRDRARGSHVAHDGVAGEGARQSRNTSNSSTARATSSRWTARTDPGAGACELNKIGGKHGIGRLDMVENRYVGMKSRGCYETPGGTIMLKATARSSRSRWTAKSLHLKDDLMPRYARMIYNGYWCSPERTLLQTTDRRIAGARERHGAPEAVQGQRDVVGRKSKTDSLFDPNIATFEDDGGAYNQADAAGFIKLNALRMRIGARRGRE